MQRVINDVFLFWLKVQSSFTLTIYKNFHSKNNFVKKYFGPLSAKLAKPLRNLFFFKNMTWKSHIFELLCTSKYLADLNDLAFTYKCMIICMLERKIKHVYRCLPYQRLPWKHPFPVNGQRKIIAHRLSPSAWLLRGTVLNVNLTYWTF